MNGVEINIAKIIEAKSRRPLPRPIIHLIRKLIHEAEINDILRRHHDKEGLDFLTALLQDFATEVVWRNPNLLPPSSRVIFVSNHPLGAIDGIGISYLLAKHYGEVKYLVNDMLYNLKPLRPLFIPINTYGRQQRNNVELLNEVLSGDIAVGTFPAGWCSRYLDGRVQDYAWKPSFINMAINHQRDIVPLHFVGQNSRHFYLVDRLRRALGLNFDICTALLPDEMFRAKGGRFEVIIGETISWQSLCKEGETPQEQAKKIRALSYALAEDK